MRKRLQAQRDQHVGLALLPPGHASKIHVHATAAAANQDDAARPANRSRGTPSDFVSTLTASLLDRLRRSQHPLLVFCREDPLLRLGRDLGVQRCLRFCLSHCIRPSCPTCLVSGRKFVSLTLAEGGTPALWQRRRRRRRRRRRHSVRGSISRFPQRGAARAPARFSSSHHKAWPHRRESCARR